MVSWVITVLLGFVSQGDQLSLRFQYLHLIIFTAMSKMITADSFVERLTTPTYCLAIIVNTSIKCRVKSDSDVLPFFLPLYQLIDPSPLRPPATTTPSLSRYFFVCMTKFNFSTTSYSILFDTHIITISFTHLYTHRHFH